MACARTAGAALDAYVAGDAAAFETIHEAYATRLLNLARKLLVDRHAAQDTVQETFLRLCRGAGGLRDPRRLAAWLFRTCRNLAVDRIRVERRQEEAAQALARTTLHPRAVVESRRERRERLEHVLRGWRSLSVNQRRCIALKVADGRSYREISRITGLSVSNVGYQIHVGLRRLAPRMRG